MESVKRTLARDEFPGLDTGTAPPWNSIPWRTNGRKCSAEFTGMDKGGGTPTQSAKDVTLHEDSAHMTALRGPPCTGTGGAPFVWTSEGNARRPEIAHMQSESL